MNICLVCNEFPPVKCGGIGIFTDEFAKALVKNGHKVWVVGVYNNLEEKFISKEGVNVIRLKSEKGKLSFYKNSRKLGKYIKKLIKKEKLDVIEVPDFEGIHAFWPKLNIPVITRLHGSVTYFAREMEQKESKLTYFIEKRALKKSNYIVSVSKYTADKTRKIFSLNHEIKVIYNGVNIPSYHKTDFNYKGVVAFSGSLMRKKGVFSLAKAWNLVKKDFPDAKLLLIGKNTIENGVSVKEKIFEIVEKKYHDSLIFTGHISKNKMEQFLMGSDVAVYPSYAEAFALTPLEAMGLSLPVIYSNRTSGNELKQFIKSLEIVDPDNIEKLAKKIKFFLKNQEKRTICGTQNRKDIIKFFDIEKKLKENIDYFMECVK